MAMSKRALLSALRALTHGLETKVAADWGARKRADPLVHKRQGNAQAQNPIHWGSE